MRELSAKRAKPQTIGDDAKHGVEFLRGQAVAVLCPKKGRCVIDDQE